MTKIADLPELSVKTDRFGDTAWDYRVFLCHGMSSMRKQTADKMLKKISQVRSFRAARLSLVLALRDYAKAQFDESPSHRSFVSNYQVLRNFYVYCDEHGLDPTAMNIVDIFIDWSEDRRSNKHPKYHYSIASRLSRMLSEITDISVDRFRIPARLISPSPRANSGRVDTQNLAKTFLFGELVSSISSLLSTENITGPLPLKFGFVDKTLELWSGIPSDDALRATHASKGHPEHEWQPDQHRIRTLAAGSLAARRTLVNLRIEAELAIFLAQTGMNLAQAFTLSVGRFRYRTRDGGYLVKGIYKDRRGGEVAFEVFKAYRRHFERYLKWRTCIAEADDPRLFPFAIRPGDPPRQEHHSNGLRRLCQQAGIAYIGARELRCTRVNYFLRRSDDFVLTAAVAQHSVGVLMSYQRPNHQRAATEVTGFWNHVGSPLMSAGTGSCSGSPQPMPARPGQPVPDCRSVAGCLFCLDHRDEMSLDYAWSLVSYRYLKSLELAAYPPTREKSSEPTTPEIVITVLSEKLKQMCLQHVEGSKLVQEAEDRAIEGDFHPRWSDIINAAESYHDTTDL
ncbi:hypothetical protein [Xanthomonas pisi]|uniref:Integrase n=1 Tax=Xanthomonas pisi TaxID=56457 RepID=A0A2S7CY00_9XANT|nr:hypothetical protein [Xanthomonas pisi]KLD71238.1 hypothetical protein Y887_07460 [Xanthomonas pisi DSM 18956]PPU66463.1 hypothetical protein XpiCFBP4643_19065 [Xanthomonas pisi]